MTSLEDVFDREAALATVLNDSCLLGKLVDLFADYYPELLDDLRDAIQADDATRVQEIAQRLKGAVSTFHARDAYRTALELEQIAHRGQLEDALPLYRCLAERVLTLVAALGDLVDELQAIR